MKVNRGWIGMRGWFALVASLVLLGASAFAYNEAPMLREMVERGEIPPVEERLPTNPMVVPVYEEIGEYGGTWTRAASGTGDVRSGMQRLLQERWFHLDEQLNMVYSILEDHEFTVADEETVFRGVIREGIRWSDGARFTVDDIVFAYEDIARYSPDPDEDPLPPDWLVSQGEPAELIKIDDYTFEFRLKGPAPLFEMLLMGPGDGTFLVNNPRHFVEELHPEYAPRDDMTAEEQWAELQQKNYRLGMGPWVDDPERPTILPWITEIWEPGSRLVMVRNPYYWKVDEEGNQLPYIDRIVTELVDSREAVTLRALEGRLDFQMRLLNFADMELLMAERDRGDYRVLVWETAVGADPGIFLNRRTPNLSLRELVLERDFRVALSLAINRQEINDTLWFGLAVPMNASVLQGTPYFTEGMDQLYAAYDPERANELLDNLGLTERGSDGIRLMPDGRPVEIIVDAPQPGTTNQNETLELIQEYWEDIGVRMRINVVERTLAQSRGRAGEADATAWWFDRAYVILSDMRLVPTTNLNFYDPLAGEWVLTGGARGKEPEGVVKELLDLWTEIRVTTDEDEREAMIKELAYRTAEEAFIIGAVGRTPLPVVVRSNFHNVPEGPIPWDFVPLTPKNVSPEQFFIRQ